MNKKVAIVVCSWPPLGGGIGNNAYYHLKWLLKYNIKAEAFTPDYGQKKEVSDLPVNYLKVFLPLGKAGLMLDLLKKIKDFEIIHFYYPFFGSDLLICILKKIYPEKKILLHYQMDPIGQGVKKIIFWLYMKIFFGIIVKCVDKIAILSFDHCFNSYLAKFYKKYQNKFVEIPNGVETNFFTPGHKNEELLRLNNFSVQDKIIIFVGGLDEQHFFKGVPILLKAFQQVSLRDPLAKLLIIGDGNLKSNFQDLARKLNLQDKVNFVGWVDNDKLPDYYCLADIFVLPSTESTESFGIVVAEAQACGLPVIVSNWPGVRTTLIDGKTGFLVKPKDVNDLSEKIIKLLFDKQLSNYLGRNGRERSVNYYSWNQIINKLISIYQEL